VPIPILSEVGDLNTTHHRVTPGDLADTHHDSSPPVLATSRLVQWCEHTVREALPGAATVAAVQINHRSPAVLGTLATVRVECTEVTQWTTMWKVTVAAGEARVADGTITLNAIDLQDYTDRIVNPLVRHHKLIPTSEDQGP
jgi:predicted thioesterase